MGKNAHDVWPQFDALIAQAASAETKALIAAIRLQTEFLDLRLSQIESNTAYQLQKDMRSSFEQ
jgi:hypothetical protein